MKWIPVLAVGLGCIGARAAAAQAGDSVLVEVTLTGIGSALVVAAQDPLTGELQLPVAPIYSLAGLHHPMVQTATVAELRDLLRIEVSWLPRQLRLVLRDPWQVLPATRARVDQLRADNAGRPGSAAEHRQVGPFGSVAMDDRREARFDLGYSLGRVYGRGAYSTLSGASWSAGANPFPAVWLAYAQSERSGPRLSARIALKRSWIAAEYDADQVHVSGASALGPLVLFASSNDRFAVTWRGSVDVQVGHSGKRSAVRVSFGALDPSPISIPTVY